MDVSAWGSCPQSEDYGISGTVEVLCDIRTDLVGLPKCYLDIVCSSLPYVSLCLCLSPFLHLGFTLSVTPHPAFQHQGAL